MKSIRGLALAVLAAAALAAVPAAASASGGFVADQYPATLHGSQLSGLGFQFGSSGPTFICEQGTGLTFEGTLAKAYPSASSSKITDPSKCNSGGLTTNGCQLIFHPGTGTLDIGPSGCGPLKISMTNCPAGLFSIPAQTGISATYSNSGSGSEANFHVSISDKSVEYTAPASNLCKKAGTYNDLYIFGELKVSATNAEKKPIGTSVITGNVPMGLFLTNGPARLAAPEYPVRLTGERVPWSEFAQITLFTLGPGTGKVTCKEASFDGGELSGPVEEFSLNATYSKCTAGPMSVTVNMNSCHYGFSGLEQISEKGEYDSTAKIACSKEGDAIVITGSGCVVKLPAQVLGGQPTEMTNLVEGYESTVSALVHGSSVHYTTIGANCQLAGWGKEHTGEDGSLELDLLLHGVYP